MKLFESNFVNVILRFYTMMAIVLLAGFTGLWWLAILALPILISAMLSVKVFDRKVVQHQKSRKLVRIQGEQKPMKTAV